MASSDPLAEILLGTVATPESLITCWCELVSERNSRVAAAACGARQRRRKWSRLAALL